MRELVLVSMVLERRRVCTCGSVEGQTGRGGAYLTSLWRLVLNGSS